MYLLIGISMVLTAAMLASLATSFGLTAGWSLLTRIASELGAKAESRFWMGVGLLPVAVGACFGFLVVGPGYIRYEPHNTGEQIGPVLAGLAMLSAAMVAVALWRCGAVLVRAARLSGELKVRARRVAMESIEHEVFELPEDSRVSTVVGVVRPTIFFSKAVLKSLDEAELKLVLRHELAHVRAGDNGTALMLDFARRLTANPVFMRAVRSHWMEAAEIAADCEAVRSREEAVDLLSALLKVARLRGSSAIGALGCSFVPKASKSHLRRRIESLQAMADGREIATGGLSVAFKSGLIALAVTLLVVAQSLAGHAHASMELLMR
jgi:beta-lactamase regulating signal transducer with metallopeptidase domain